MSGKTFGVGEVLSSADVNEYLAGGYWKRINRHVISSGSPVTSVSFASISSIYNMFRLSYSVNTSANDLNVRINNDIGASAYNNTRVVGTSVEVSSSQNIWDRLQLSTSGSSVQVTGQLFISKLISSQRAMIVGSSATYSIGGGFQNHYSFSCNWNNTSNLIDRIDVLVFSGTYYGVVALEAMEG